MSVIKLLLWSEDSFLPSKETCALVLKKKNVNRINAELNMYGKSEITKSNLKSEIIEKAASVIPIEKDPVLPTNILPLKLKKASNNHTAIGAYNRIA